MAQTTGEVLAAALDWVAAGRPDPMPAAAADVTPEVWAEIDNLFDAFHQRVNDLRTPTD